MYKVIQNVPDKEPVLWCSTSDFEFLCSFCQYLIDGTNEDALGDFRVTWENKRTGKSKRKLFTDFCEVQGIRKRTFEERMAGK